MNEDIMHDEAILNRVKTIMDRLDKDQELQDLAERNGVDAVNTIRLTPTTKDNVAVTMLSLLLAQKAGDPRYKNLSALGLQKRSIKADIVNEYKGQAIQLMNQYRNSQQTTAPIV